MRNLFNALIPCMLLAPGLALAQANAEEVYCEMCRDPLQYPDDYINFAYNQVYGDESWMNFDQADDFFIINAHGDRVYVDIDYVMLGADWLGIEVPFWPTNMLQITLALPNGLIYTSVRSIFMNPLPVPSSPEPEPGDTGYEGDDNDKGVDDPEGELEPEPELDEEWGPVGVTGIQDPDENGEFPDPDWCEEC